MFKKGKKKKQEKATKENGKIADGSNESKAYTKGAPKNSSDQTDGFDKDGFVDLQPIASNVTILGPRQSCKAIYNYRIPYTEICDNDNVLIWYVGTFAVISSADGRKSLRTHKERTSYMKEHLKNYRSTTNGVAVLVQVSDDGIKVLSSDGKRVRMAYPLQRISFATCDPDFCLFAFMTNSPSPMGVTVHGHVFVCHRPRQVQDITAMIGKAFKMAFAASRMPSKPPDNDQDEKQTKAARRWAKHEATRGHERSEHAEKAAELKRKEKKEATKHNSFGSFTDGSPVLHRAGVQMTGHGQANDDVVTDALSDAITPMTISSPRSRKTSDPLPPLPTERIQSPTHLSRDTLSRKTSDPLPLPPTVANQTPVADGHQGRNSISRQKSDPLPPTPTEAIQTPTSDKNQLQGKPLPLRPLSEFVTTPISATAISAEAPALPSRGQGQLTPQTSSASTDDEHVVAMPDSNTKTLLGNMRAETPTMVGGGAKVEYLGSPSEEEAVQRLNDHQNEYWYMPGIPRMYISTCQAFQGMYIVYDYQNEYWYKPGIPRMNVGTCQAFQGMYIVYDYQNEYWYMPGIPRHSKVCTSCMTTRMNIGTCQAFQGLYIVYDYQNECWYMPGIPRHSKVCTSCMTTRMNIGTCQAFQGLYIVYDYQNECWYMPGIPRMNVGTCQAFQGMYIVYDYQNEYWYMPGIPREFIMEMLQASEEGSFFVRDSQSKPGCHALTVRVPTEVHASGFGNYLITPIPEGVKLEGFSRTFTDLVSLIEYYSYHADGLPCRLLLGGSNILCNDDENNDYIYSVPLDPDYRLMSDFHSMMEELK
ncbi:predicted protein [Nematostella vectensis]|uniref:Uncharacterized protein n=1 Tax=Nematostella vectensis TaxID=45351 RepID=A7RU23_NEMVE|nr:predicted protein [Nematostella vectensis]|eukprot:XP_001637071.1 predicted protein [Nematostella vectensis]